jgi:hypothetical protein
LDKRKNRRELLEDRLLGISLNLKDVSHLKDFGEEDFTEGNRPAFKAFAAGKFAAPKDLAQTDPELAARIELLSFITEVGVDVGENLEGELLRVKAELKKLLLKERMAQVAGQLKAAELARNKELLAKLSEQFTKLTQEYHKYNQ